MASFTIGDKAYRSAQMDVYKQAHVLRRLGPIIPVLTIILKARESGMGLPDVIAYTADALTSAFGKLSDADTEYVFNACLAVTQFQQSGTLWVDIAPGGVRMFEGMSLFEIVSITGYVLQDNLGPFYSALQAIAPLAGTKAA